MEIVYNSNSQSFLLLENNNQIPLEKVITQCINYQDLNHLDKIIGLITGKYVEHLNMIQKLLETNNNAEIDNDDLCKKISEQYLIIKTSNDKITHLEQQLQQHKKKTNDTHHKLWIQFLEEKKKNEKMENLVDNLTKENNTLFMELIHEKKKNELITQDYDMLSDVSYTS